MSVLLSRLVILEIVNALTGALVGNQLPVAANLADVDFLARRPVVWARLFLIATSWQV
jgi:hypothetical protein